MAGHRRGPGPGRIHRIIATYTVFSHTYDDARSHACGLEWLDKGVYRWDALADKWAQWVGHSGQRSYAAAPIE